MKKILTISFAVFLLAGCTGVLRGTTQIVDIRSSEGEGIQASISSSGGFQNIDLPHTTSIKRSNKPIVINIKEDACYNRSSYSIEPKFEPFFLVNMVGGFSSTSSSATDVMNSGNWKYDETIIVPVSKKPSCKTK